MYQAKKISTRFSTVKISAKQLTIPSAGSTG